jgi:hypothetical protein
MYVQALRMANPKSYQTYTKKNEKYRKPDALVYGAIAIER